VTHICVLGRSIATKAVASAAWSSVAELEALDNFDVIILDLTTAESADRDSFATREVELWRFLCSSPRDDRELIVIGHATHADQLIALCPAPQQLDGRQYRRSDGLSDGFDRWFDSVDRFHVAFGDGWVGNSAGRVAGTRTPLAETKTGLALGLTYSIASPSGGTLPIHWLPEVSVGSLDESITALLRDRFGIDVLTEAPAWVDAYPRLPRHDVAAIDVDGIRREITRLQGELAASEATLTSEGRFVGLLYEQGPVLEVLVRDALRHLGADVTEPERRGGDDGRLTDPTGRRAALEIKGIGAQVGLGHIRQLMDWVDEIREQEPDNEWTGLFVSNAQRLDQPALRGEAFAPNARQRLGALGFSSITTVEIYDALRLQQADPDFDVAEWWRRTWLAGDQA